MSEGAFFTIQTIPLLEDGYSVTRWVKLVNTYLLHNNWSLLVKNPIEPPGTSAAIVMTWANAQELLSPAFALGLE